MLHGWLGSRSLPYLTMKESPKASPFEPDFNGELLPTNIKVQSHYRRLSFRSCDVTNPYFRHIHPYLSFGTRREIGGSPTAWESKPNSTALLNGGVRRCKPEP